MKSVRTLCLFALLLMAGCGQKGETAKEAAKETVTAPTRYLDVNIKAEQDAKKVKATAEKANADLEKAMKEADGK
jgi:thiamine biosynthesis lipoprotein ApbE